MIMCISYALEVLVNKSRSYGNVSRTRMINRKKTLSVSTAWQRG